MIPTPPSRSRRAALRALGTAALTLVVALAVSAPAGAATPCGKKVIDDWYDNGRVDGTYDLHCYDDAIDALPRDVRDYSSAKEDIERALQARMQGKPAPPSSGDPSPTTTGSGGSGGSGSGGSSSGDGAAVDPDDLDGDGVPNAEDPTPTRPGDAEGVPEAIGGDVDTAASDSVPLPLLVLAGLALLLVAAGAVGYVTRRLQARRIPPTA